MIPMMETPHFIDHPPPSYEQVINNQQLRPPCYEDAIIHKKPALSEDTIITAQPEDLSWLQNINIVGISKGELFGAEKNIPYFHVLSNNYLAFDHRAINCYNCYKCSEGDNFTIIDTDNNTENNVLFSYNSKSLIKSVAIRPNNQSVAMILSENENNKLALFSINSANTKTLLTDDLISDKIYIKPPTDKPYSTYYDTNDNLYLVGLKNQQLFLWTAKFILGEQSAKWEELIYLDADSNAEVTFSKDGDFLFILQSDKTLKIFSRDCNWSQIKTIPNIESFPADTNSTAEFMVFVNKGVAQIHGFGTDINFVVTDNNYITAACFIPDTKNLLLFDSANKKVTSLEYHDNDWIIDNSKSIKLGVVVKQAYFNPNDKTQLIVLFVKPNKDNEEFIQCIPLLYIVGLVGGSCGGILTTCCVNGIHIDKIYCTTLCCKNVGIGLSIGAGAMCYLIPWLYGLYQVTVGFAKSNKIDTQLKTLKQPNSNDIERF